MPEITVVLPDDLSKEQVEFVHEQFVRMATSLHNGHLIVALELPEDLEDNHAQQYADAVQEWTKEWFSH